MRGLLALVPIASLALAGCAVSLSSAPQVWTTGFWFWKGSSTSVTWSNEPLDVLFVQVGDIHHETWPALARGPFSGWSAYGLLPRRLPAARDYWLVYRYDRQDIPDLKVVPMIADRVGDMLSEARERGLHVAGVQLDIDSPTGSLAQYAAFLRELRKSLPDGAQISITALLDWFRSGTEVGAVIRETDEFVPQFYDLVGNPDGYEGLSAIGAKIDAARWGPVFNRFEKRFRVGISTFGRAMEVSKPDAPGRGYPGFRFYGDLAPIDIATNPAFQLQTASNEAKELVLRYRVMRHVRISYNTFEPGETIQFVVATPESVRTAVESARRITGHMAGVVFFRWPGDRETLAMQPGEVLSAAGLRPEDVQAPYRIHTADGHCAAVSCVDVFVESTRLFSAKAVRYRIRASTELEYFLPEKKLAVRMTGPSEIELSLPPYCARSSILVGRAVTVNRAEFTVEAEQ